MRQTSTAPSSGVTVTIFVLVGGWLLYSAIRFRARPGDPDIEPPQVHGSTRLELGWTIVAGADPGRRSRATRSTSCPTVKDAPSNSMIVNVMAQQFCFTYLYGVNAGAPPERRRSTAHAGRARGHAR